MVQDNPGEWRQLDRSVIDLLAVGVVWQAVDGRVIDANAAAAPILGLTRDELLGRTPRDPRWYAVREDGSLWPGDEHPGSVALRTGVAQHGAVMGIMAPDCGRRWISIHATPLFEDGGPKPTGVVASFVDVTAQVELRRQLEAHARELTELYERAPCGHHMLDLKGRFLRINDTELRWLGVTRDQVVGRLGPYDFLSRESKDLFRESFPRILAGESIDGLELDLVGAQGQRRYVRVQAEPVRDADRRVMATRAVLHDITEMRARSLSLEKLSAAHAVVLDNDLIGIVRVRKRKIVWTNRAFDRMFGYAPDELLGRTSEVLFDDAEAYRAFGAELVPRLRARRSYRARLLLRRKDGSQVLSDSCAVVMDSEAAEVMWFSLDITEQHRAEALRVQAAELENENRQLRETSRLHQLFMSNISHELRTPLNGVIGYAQLMLRQARSGDVAKLERYASQIAASGQHLLTTIDAILETVNAQAGRVVFHPVAFDVRTAVDEVVAMLMPKASQRRVDVHVDVATDRPVRLDPLRFRQILLNYVGNAIKFSNVGGRVDVRARLDDPGHLRIEVEDRGIGIAPEHLPALFGHFHQLSAGTAKTHEGTGIGLALVKMLVEAQGGTVGVTSVRGEGSVFSAVLPLDAGAA